MNKKLTVKSENSLSHLKEKLNEIDRQVYQEVSAGFYSSRLKIEIGMWEKGKAIGDFTPPPKIAKLSSTWKRNRKKSRIPKEVV